MSESGLATVTDTGSAGMADGLLSSPARLAGGRPTSTPIWYWADATRASRSGTAASVKLSWARARSVSNAVPRPASSRCWVTCRVLR